MARVFLALALAAPAAALVTPVSTARGSVKVDGGKADLAALCRENPTALGVADNGIWDPLGCSDYDFWGLGNEATIGYLRHAEIKHGRVAMAGFLGFLAQSPGNPVGDIVSGEHALLPYRGYVAGCSPQEQWDNIPTIGKLQILVAVGMLESYGEGAGDPTFAHYTRGGKPGYYPPIVGKGPPGQIVLNLWDPFQLIPAQDEATKKNRLFAEVNNGRLAMIGLFSLLAESRVPGSNPQFQVFGIDIPDYDGNIMASVFPKSLDNEFAGPACLTLGVCAFLQQLQKRRSA
jgi:hypothetical protein